MRNGGLRKVDARFNVPRAKTRCACLLPLRPGIGFAFLKSVQDSATRRIGDGVEGAVKG